MTVVFYVDPSLVKDSDQADLNTITLSYTFYRLLDLPDRLPVPRHGWAFHSEATSWLRIRRLVLAFC